MCTIVKSFCAVFCMHYSVAAVAAVPVTGTLFSVRRHHN